MRKHIFIILLLFFALINYSNACSIIYYIDTITGKVYAANNEDFFFNVKPYIEILPADKEGLARLWYGWNNFAQGGINEAGLFFDGAVTPQEPDVMGYVKPKGNLGNEILARCKTVNDAVIYLEQQKTALTNGHLLFGDKTGNAVVVEWVNGRRNLIPIKDNQLMITNFLLTDTLRGNYPCPRYNAMQTAIEQLRQGHDTIGLKQIGSIAAKAVQPKSKNGEGKESGTLYSSFINITDMEFVLVYKLDNSKITRLDLKKEFANPQKRIIKLQ